LFNGRTNKSNARFTCPNCCLVNPTSAESREDARKVVKGSSDLPRCKMSDALENGLFDALNTAYSARSIELGLPFENIEKADGLCGKEKLSR
jgi:E1A/CREB-binding protein